MTRRDALAVLVVLTGICTASWVIATYPWFGWVLLAGALLYAIVGGIVVLGPTARSREVSQRHPARRDSLPRSDGQGLHRSTRSQRARTTSPGARAARPSTSRWL